MGVFKNRCQQLCSSPLQALADWQRMRWWWLTSAVVALSMNLIAHYIFQIAMGLEACEKCVYIRYAMFNIVFGGLIAAINPQYWWLRLVGYAATFYGAIFGAIWSWQLIDHYNVMKALDNGADPFAAGLGSVTCSLEPTFHFNLPLHIWFPEWFAPMGVCGSDQWYFLGLSMGSWTFIIFSTYILLLTLSVITSLIVNLVKCRSRA